ncbi:MAG: GlxA family transcriptional regulator [Marivivens sp.]|jgi:transcriptional regulator GlxA family with amidase domain|nr:GlxA family transcriptional regulator [Marivivens sp.]
MKRIAFVLLDGFALMSTASALEPLRAANQFSTTTLYDISLLSLNGDNATSSLGSRFSTQPFDSVEPNFDLVFIVAGGDPRHFQNQTLFSWLRRIEASGVAIGGISGGSVVLARAGLLNRHRFTVHWHHYDDFEAMTGPWLLERRLFVIDRNRYTCAGGSAPLDMMHAIIARDHGITFAHKISNWFIQTEIRSADAPQIATIPSRYGQLPHTVKAAIGYMETHIADPLNQEQLAQLVGLSVRHLQRLFHEHVGRSVMEEYRMIRLETAKSLLASTLLPMSEITALTGFANQGHLSNCFKMAFGVSPLQWRKRSSEAKRSADH